MARNWLTPDRWLLLSLVLAAALYSPTLQADFVFDDVHLILLNDHLNTWRQWPVAFTEHVWAFHQPPAGARHYRPVFVLWLLINKQLFGDIAPWWHLTSLLLHLLVTSLVYRLGVRLLKSAWIAAVAAVIFALHPVHIEAVAWISASTDLLATTFLLGAFLCYLRHREEARSLRLLASIALFALALLSKETAAMFPAVIFLYEWLAGSKTSLRPPWWRSLPFFGVTLLYVIARKIVIPISAPSASDADRFTQISSLPLVAVEYAKTLVWPFQLSFFYAPADASHWTTMSVIAVLVVAVGMIALVRFARTLPAARLPLGWLVVFSIPPLVAIAVFTRDNWVHDRHMYLPSVGFCLLLAMLLFRLGSWRNVAVIALSAVFAIALVLQLPRFHNELSLYEHAMRRSPANIEMRLAYADALQLHGRAQDSQNEYERIAKMAPDSAEAFTYLGMNYDDLGQTQKAKAALERAVAASAPGSHLRLKALFRLGLIELRLREAAAAEAHFRAALELDPQRWNFHASLADALRQQGKNAEADREMLMEEAARKALIAKRARTHD